MVVLSAVAISPVGADQVLLACTASPQKSTLNPPLHSGDSKYFKSVSKSTGGAICLVDPGIRTDQSTQDVKYTLDNQTNGEDTLTVASSSTSNTGSFTCNATDPANLITYPASYPGQGKLITKFVEFDALGHPLQLQAYVRLTHDATDPEPLHLLVKGIVIKGVGVGGDVHAVVSIFPDLLSPKNLNIADCAASPASGNATLAVLDVTPADGSDADTSVDLWTVSVPSP